MPEYNWPSREAATLIGKPVKRQDGLVKATGAAKYTYDVNLKNQLIVRALGCPHGHCRIRSIDTSAAEATPGVVFIDRLKEAGNEIEWEGELILAVAAESEAAAAEGASKVKVDYEVLTSFTLDEDIEAAQMAERTLPAGGKVQLENEPGDDDDEDEFAEKEIARLLAESKHTVEGYYGIDVITHCCLEPHGATVEWKDGKLTAYLSTQNVSGTDEGFANDLKIAPGDVEVRCDYMGGGFGSKFAPDYWAISAARISKATGRPVKFLLSRDQELKLGGNRPSGYIKVKLGADENGLIQVWDSNHWGTGGAGGNTVAHGVIPYVLVPKNYRRNAIAIKANGAPLRAWRAPNHPQACAMSQTAIDDLARVMGADSYDIFLRNLEIADNGKADVYKAEMEIAAEAMDWKAKWHAHGKGPAKGSIVEGLGMALHTWGGGANQSSCMLRVRPDGTVETFCGTQDLGTGTRTVCGQIVADTFGLPMEAVKVNIGNSKLPISGASGGSTTIGGISESHRRASQDALEKLLELAAKKLEVAPADLEVREGRVRVKGGDKSLAWKEVCALLELKPLEVTAEYVGGTRSPLSNSQVGGVQMAHVAVDRETGVIKMKKFVAVQDIGLVMNPRLAESQMNGAVIMGIAYSLFEQRLLDPKTGAFVNAELADYKLARLGDVGEIVIKFYEPESERGRGVVGIGEPPVISPGAAISNAVCNALGVRVPVLPMTPQRVLAALEKAKV